MGFSKNLRALLVQNDISQNALAETVGVSAPTVSRWLSGNMSVRTAHLEALCAAFEVTKDDLLSDSHGLAAQLGAGSFGIEAAASVPLLEADEIDLWVSCGEMCSRRRIDVPRDVVRNRPKAFAYLNLDDGVDRAVPHGAHVVVDPGTQPGNASTVALRLGGAQHVALRRMHRGNSTLLLTTNSHAREEDLVVREGDEQAQVIGTVVWYQAANLL